jgi:putative nucleotide binding protein
VKDLFYKRYEDRAVVLDFLPQGHVDDPRPIHLREPIAQVMGDSFFTLLEVVPKEGVTLTPHAQVLLGKEERDKIDRVRRRIGYDDLTAAAKAELRPILEEIVNRAPERFIEFFNRAGPLTVRFHQLELFPGIGKKLMWEIIEERKKEPFADFKDLKRRVEKIPPPQELVVGRVIMELQGVDKYRLFVRQPSRKSLSGRMGEGF